jgi:hypothetical protein
MNRLCACLVFTLLSVAVSPAQYTDRIAHLKDAPFSAEVQGSYTTPNSSIPSIEEIARAADGTTYKATIEPTGEFKGTIRLVQIEDVIHACNIGVYPSRANLTKDSQGDLVGARGLMQVSLESGNTPASPPPSIEDFRQRYLCEQEGINSNSLAYNNNPKIRRTSLGQRTVDGMTIFGFQQVHMSDSKTDRVDEHWESDMGFTYSQSTTKPIDGTVSAHSVTSLMLAEPPAELFTIQDRYFPRSKALPNARTIFISGQLGNAELTNRIQSILTASGRFTLVSDSKNADLIVSKFDAVNPGDPSYTSAPQIMLKFNRPNGFSIFVVSFRFKGARDQWAESPVVNTCFADVWKRVESVQVSPASLDDDFF